MVKAAQKEASERFFPKELSDKMGFLEVPDFGGSNMASDDLFLHQSETALRNAAARAGMNHTDWDASHRKSQSPQEESRRAWQENLRAEQSKLKEDALKIEEELKHKLREIGELHAKSEELQAMGEELQAEDEQLKANFLQPKSLPVAAEGFESIDLDDQPEDPMQLDADEYALARDDGDSFDDLLAQSLESNITKVLWGSEDTTDVKYEDTVILNPGTTYSVSFEVLRKDLEPGNEVVTEASIDGQNIGIDC